MDVNDIREWILLADRHRDEDMPIVMEMMDGRIYSIPAAAFADYRFAMYDTFVAHAIYHVNMPATFHQWEVRRIYIGI